VRKLKMIKQNNFIMKDELDIIKRIEELRDTMKMLENKKVDELKKSFKDRDYRLLRFLHKEYSVYDFAVSQLEWVFTI
jgi:hypothetical protein